MTDIRLFIVDDQHLVRTGLVRMLGESPGCSVCGEAETGEQALEKIQLLADINNLPDVVLMDLRMPGIGGLETTRKLVSHYPVLKVIAVTGCDENPFPQRFLESGAAGFITKDSAIEEVLLAIRTVHRGKRYLSQDVAQNMALNTMQPSSQMGNSNLSPFASLSERELQIALMVIDGMKVADIATQLQVSPKTINTYRYRLFEKLNITSNMDLALLASRHGLLENNSFNKNVPHR